MAQSALTVTPPNPTPPTNFGFTGVSGPNPPNFTKNTYNDPKNWSATNPKDFPPPYYDDGSAGSGVTFAANVAALASGSGDTAGGTGNPQGSSAGTPGTYPGGVIAQAGDPPWRGTVPASASAAHEGAGTETLFTQTYNTPQILAPIALQMVGCGPALPAQAVGFGSMPVPNQVHASSLSKATNPALASIAPTTAVHAASGTDTITATGTNFTPQSVICKDGVPIKTTYVSATSLTAAVPKSAAAGTSQITVVTGGVVVTAGQTLTYT